MSDSLKYWQDLACANRKVAEDAQAQRGKARVDALEEAAQVCDELREDYKEDFKWIHMHCAAAIRAMKVEK
jgi:hypothetical protein